LNLVLKQFLKAIIRLPLDFPWRRSTGSHLGPSAKLVDLPSGLKVRIRAVDRRAFMEFVRSMPDGAALIDVWQGDRTELMARPGVIGELDMLMDAMLVRSVIEPELVTDRRAGPTARDFSPADRTFLIREIAALSKACQAKGK